MNVFDSEFAFYKRFSDCFLFSDGLEKDDTVLSAKQHIWKEQRIPVERQRLSYKGIRCPQHRKL